jgi:PAS domain S-box-containing protein
MRLSPRVRKLWFRLSSARIGTRLAACFVLIAVAMLVADVVALWQFRRTAAPAEQLAKANRISLAVVRVHFDTDTFRDNLAELASARDIAQFRSAAAAIRHRFVEDVAQCAQVIESSPDAQQDPVIRSALETLRVTLPSQIDTSLDLASAGDWAAVNLRMKNQVQALVELSSLLVKNVEAQLEKERAEAIQTGDHARRQLVVVLPVAAVLTLLVAVVLGWTVTRSITDPLSEVEAGARALAKGDFEHRVPMRGEDELTELARVLNDSAQRLAVLYDTLRSNEARFRLAVDTIPAYVWSTLPDGSVDFINQRWLDFSGSSLEQGLGYGWEHALHPDDRTPFLEAWAAAVASGKGMEFEARVRRADGQYRWLLIRNVPLHNETGQIVKWYGTSADIDDRKRIEEALRRSEAYLAEAQRLSHTGSWAFDLASGTFVYASDECRRMYEVGELDALPTREATFRLIHPEDQDRVQANFEKSVSEKVDTSSEFRLVLPSGTVKHVKTVRHPVLNHAGDVVQLVGTTIDITERKRAEEERERLRELQAELAHINRVSMMGEMAASIAHEVNQPLAGIVSNGSACLRLLAADPPDVQEVREAVADIVRDAKRAGEVIARIRTLTRRVETPRENLDLNESIREVLALVADEVKGRGAVIKTQLAGGLWPVSGDKVQLQQVLLNIIVNGLEAMSSVNERSRELVITTRNIESDQVQVTVADSGIGLDPNAANRIFDPFYTTKSGGMGMGLSISRSILHNHSGRLWATPNDGPGASFYFSLPKCQGQAAHAELARV